MKYTLSLAKKSIVLAGLICLSSIPSPAYAQETTLKLSPAVFTVRTTPPADVRLPFTLENSSTNTLTFAPLYKRFKQSSHENGQVQLLTEAELAESPDPQLFAKMQLVEDGYSLESITLAPKQKKQLELRIAVPKEQQVADYYFTTFFVTQPDETRAFPSTTNSTLVQQGVGMNVVLSVGPKETPKAYLDTFSTPWYQEAGPVNFTVRVSNDGSQFITPRGVILIKNMFGQTVGRIDLPKTTILAHSMRSLGDTLATNTQGFAANSQTPQAMWPEKFLLGLYSAELSLAISENGPLYSKSITFLAIPSTLLFGTVITLVLGGIILLRIRHKLRNNG